jgi:hypothetical protein
MNVVLGDQLARVLRRELGIEPVVQRHQLDALAVDAALSVDMVDVEAGAFGVLLDAGGDRAGEAGRLADHDVGPAGGAGQSGEKAQRKAAAAACQGRHACLLAALWTCSSRGRNVPPRRSGRSVNKRRIGAAYRRK